MQIHEFECPYCLAALRLRIPLRAQERFPCPDCARELEFRTVRGELSVSRCDTPEAATARPPKPAARLTPRHISRGIAALLCVALIGYLFSGRVDPDQSRAGAAASEALIEPAVPPAPLPAPPVAAGAGDMATAADPQTAEEFTGASAEPAEPDAGAVPQSLGDEPLTDDASPQTVLADGGAVGGSTGTAPAAADRRRAEQAARDRDTEMLSERIRVRLQQRLGGYLHTAPITLDEFLDDMEDLVGVRIDRRGFLSRAQTPIQCTLEDCTVGDVMSRGLAQARLTWTVRSGAVEVSKRTAVSDTSPVTSPPAR